MREFEEARQMCSNFNDNRTAAQVKRGTKYDPYKYEAIA